jgi:hypothetical protein
MRLSDVLNKAPDTTKAQVEGFLGTRRIGWGQHKKIRVGKVALNFVCKRCGGVRTFMSGDELSCLVAGERAVSIDVTLRCPICASSVETWFLVACDGDFYVQAPVVHLERYIENRRDSASRVAAGSGEFADLLERAEIAYDDHLGAGSMIYLRQIFEAITREVAKAAHIPLTTSGGKPKPFRVLLKEVDEQHHIIPEMFASNGYRLFSELSEVIHGGSSEEEALVKYTPCRQLTLGVVEKVRNDQSVASAIDALGWDVDDLPEIDGEEGAA